MKRAMALEQLKSLCEDALSVFEKSDLQQPRTDTDAVEETRRREQLFNQIKTQLSQFSEATST